MTDTAYAEPAAPVDPAELAKERAQAMFDELKPYAQRAYRAYFINHAPKEIADAMRDLVDAESPEDDLMPMPKGPPSDPPSENHLGQYAAMRAAAKAAEGSKEEVRAELDQRGPGAEQPGTQQRSLPQRSAPPAYPTTLPAYDPNQPHQ
jgi:hypothetical protein